MSAQGCESHLPKQVCWVCTRGGRGNAHFQFLPHRDAGLSILMLLLHLCVTHREAPQEECALNRAIRDAFTR